MESRVIGLHSRLAGGNSGSKSFKYSVDIPSSWIKQLDMSASDKFCVTIDGEKIVLQKRAPNTFSEFVKYARQRGHEVKIYQYMDGNVLCSRIAADFTSQQVALENHVKELDKQAFGVTLEPTWKDFLVFMEGRCIPRTRVGIENYLKAYGIDSYDVFALIRRTQGRLAEDNQWIKEIL